MTAKAPSTGKWWRLVELNTDLPAARYLTLQSETYSIITYRPDWEEYYAKYWEADKDRMEMGPIGDSYGPWHEGERPR